MSEYQGDKFQAWLKKYQKDNGISSNEAREMLNLSNTSFYSLFKSKNLTRESVSRITNAFNVSEEEIWGDDLSKSNAKPARLLGNGEPNMWDITIKAQGGFLEGYGDTILMEQNVEKVYFPFFKGECFSFEVEGLSMLPEYMPGDRFISTPVENFNHLVKGRVYVFQTVDGVILKEYCGIEDDNIYLRSLNEDYNPVRPIYLKDVKRIYQREMVIKN